MLLRTDPQDGRERYEIAILRQLHDRLPCLRQLGESAEGLGNAALSGREQACRFLQGGDH